MKKPTRFILIAIIVLFIIGLIVYPGLKKKYISGQNVVEKENTTAKTQKKTLNINVLVLKYQSMTDKAISTGDIIPDEEVDLSFETSGKITNIYFKEGSHIKKGDLLAKINDKPLLAQLKKLETQIPLAKDKVYRQKTLLEKDAVSQEAYEQVTTEYDKLIADIDLVKANIAQTELCAPFDGIIGLRMVSEGAYATPSTTIAKLTKISPIKIEFSVPEQYVDDITPGTNIVFKMTGSLQNYSGKVYAIASKVDINTRMLKVRAIHPNKDESIKPGRFASIELTKKEIKNALAIPSESLIQEIGKNIVYLYKEGKAQPVEVETGLRTESEIQIVKGLNVGDTIIVSGVMQLRTGMPVTIDKIN